MQRYYQYIFIIVGFFLTTAIIGAVIGGLIDSALNIRPVGTIASLVIMYAISWGLIRLWLKRNSQK